MDVRPNWNERSVFPWFPRPVRRILASALGSVARVTEEPPRIFRVPLRSAGLRRHHARQVAYALKKGVVGPGWGVGPPPPQSLDKALERLRRYDVGSNTVRRFAAAPTGSLVWSRDLSGRYLLGQLVGEWQYDPSSQAAAVDLENFRPVAWAPRTVLDDEVPAAVVRAWAGRSTSFHEIHSGAARLLSVRLYDQLTGKQPQPLELTQAEVVRESSTRSTSRILSACSFKSEQLHRVARIPSLGHARL